MNLMDALTKTWICLIGLTLATTALAGFDGRLAALAVLALAWLKARLILGRFLHLEAIPGWLSAFTVPLALWLALIGGLHALAL